jgi:hypothetical protein
MASTYKLLGSDDVASTKTLLYESIPVTGSLVSSSVYLGSNIKTYTGTHGMFQTVYDYPVLSASANQLFSITLGRSSDTTSTVQDTKKKTIYNQMSKVLLDLDASNNLSYFDNDGAGAAGVDLHNLYFLNFSRLLVKDEIKKGSFALDLYIGAKGSETPGLVTLADNSGSSNYFESATGEYGLLYLSSTDGNVANSGKGSVQGLIFYQAGIVAVSPYIFAQSGSNSPTAANGTFNRNNLGVLSSAINFSGSTDKVGDAFVSGSINDACDILRTRVKNIQFNNTTELNSTIYFCRLNNSEFNYSSNPTYLDGSEIRVKNGNALNAPVSYFTTVGLYSPDNQLLAVAKVSEPLRKSPSEELILRVRLDY